MYKAKRFGQKNGAGFYKYEMDRKGKPKKSLDESAIAIIKASTKNTIEVLKGNI